MNCPSCGEAEMAEENLYRCPSCGDDYTGGLAALVLDAHTAALRAEYSRVFASLSEAREVLRWVANNYRATLGRRSVRDADECLAAADRLLAPPPEATP